MRIIKKRKFVVGKKEILLLQMLVIFLNDNENITIKFKKKSTIFVKKLRLLWNAYIK